MFKYLNRLHCEQIHHKFMLETVLSVCPPFRGEGDDKDFVQIVNLLSRHCPVLKSWLDDQRMTPYSTTYTSSKSQLLAQSVRGQICAEITSAGIFSVSADTTPDTANQDKIIVAARYVNFSGILCEQMVEIMALSIKLVLGPLNVISSLRENEIDVDMLAFQTYDFAA